MAGLRRWAVIRCDVFEGSDCVGTAHAMHIFAFIQFMSVDFHPEVMGWIPPSDGIAMCQGDVG